MSEQPSFNDLVRTVYQDVCPDGSAWLDADIDQWWRFTVECDHGKWTAVSNGIVDADRGLRRAIDRAKAAHA